MGIGGEGQGKPECIQIKGFPETLFFSWPLVSPISKELSSHSQPSSFLWYPLFKTCILPTRPKNLWRGSVLLYVPTSVFLFCAACLWFIKEMWFLESYTQGLATSTKCWAVCKVSAGETKVISKLQFRKDIVYLNLCLANAYSCNARKARQIQTKKLPSIGLRLEKVLPALQTKSRHSWRSNYQDFGKHW